MNRPCLLSRFILLLGSLLLLAAFASAQKPIGTLSVVREVDVTRGPMATDKNWVTAKQNQPVASGIGIRTLKRALAEIKFKDNSVLRMNERTVLVVHEANEMRKISLQTGAVWVHVAKGANTSVETPSCTATARGTTFVVVVLPNGSSRVVVFEGRVDTRVGSQVVTVNPGQAVETNNDIGNNGNNGGGDNGNDGGNDNGNGNNDNGNGGNNDNGNNGGNNGNGLGTGNDNGNGNAGNTGDTNLHGTNTGNNGTGNGLGNLQLLNTADMPVEVGGTVVGWWSGVSSGTAIDVTTGTDVATDLRTNTTSDNPQETAPPPFVISDSNARNAFLAVMQDQFVPTIKSELLANPSWTVADYSQAHATDLISTLNLPTETQQMMASFGFTTVSHLVEAIVANGGSLNLDVRGRQVQYRPGSLYITQTSLRMLDRTKSSTAALAIGVGASLLVDARNLTVTAPKFGGMLYGFSGHPGFIGARADAQGLLGKSRYMVESNALKMTNGPASSWASRIGSVAVIERDVAPGLTLFAGRRRYIYGPVFQNQMGTQLVADRFSGAGARYTHNQLTVEGAWLYDSNAYVSGAQRGAAGSVTYKLGGGIIGLHLLEATQVTDGHGRSASYSFPVIDRWLETYGEVGKGVDDATLQTYGFYFPRVYQAYDIDLFMEYGNHQGMGDALSLIALKSYATDGDVRAYLTRQDGDWILGASAIWRFGSLSSANANPNQ